jgi:uncharacterized protein YdaU (DUF1376 family)
VTPPKMPIHIGDYKRDTGHLRAAEHGAYLLLLFHHWSTGGLPNDDRQLSAIACMSTAEWKRAKPILAPFFRPGWIHGRVMADLEKANESYEKLAAAGAKGGKAKADRKRCSSEASSDASQSLQPKAGDALPTDNRLPDDVAVDARAKPNPAFDLAERLLIIAGHSPKFWPPGWCGAPNRVETWLSQGWKPEIIVAAVTAAAARKRGEPANSVQFFERAIAEEHARQAAPLPIVEVRQPETITVNYGKPKAGIIQAADNLIAKLTEFDGPPREPDELRGDARQDSPRLLSHG